MTDKYNVCIIGEGAWTSAIANMVARNAERLSEFNSYVALFDFDSLSRKSKKSISALSPGTRMQSIAYLDLPYNIMTYTDIVEAGKNADLFVFVLEIAKLKVTCELLRGMISPTAFAISLVRDLTLDENGSIELSTQIIANELKISSSKLVGANLPINLCAGDFCEAVIGCHDAKYSRLMMELLRSENFRLCIVDDVESVEIYSKLKLMVAYGCGLIDGLEFGETARAAIIRIGIQEMIKFLDIFYPGGKMSTFFESVGLSDIVNACYGHRGRVMSDSYARNRKSVNVLEANILQANRVAASKCAYAINKMLHKKGLEAEYPLFTTIYKITRDEEEPAALKQVIRNSSDEIYHPNNILPL